MKYMLKTTMRLTANEAHALVEALDATMDHDSDVLLTRQGDVLEVEVGELTTVRIARDGEEVEVV